MAQKKKQSKATKGRNEDSKSELKKRTQTQSKSANVGRRNSPSENADSDIINLILEDHKPLKEMIETLKDEDVDAEDKMACFEEFAPTLVAHAKPEEETLYKAMKEDEDLRTEGFEGEVEHTLADQLIEEIKRTQDEDEWCAKVKVLAEIVEHHIEEEEENLLPDYKKSSERDERQELGQEYLTLKEEYENRGGDDAPHESEIEEAS